MYFFKMMYQYRLEIGSHNVESRPSIPTISRNIKFNGLKGF
jgi:hypothetical protein